MKAQVAWDTRSLVIRTRRRKSKVTNNSPCFQRTMALGFFIPATVEKEQWFYVLVLTEWTIIGIINSCTTHAYKVTRFAISRQTHYYSSCSDISCISYLKEPEEIIGLFILSVQPNIENAFTSPPSLLSIPPVFVYTSAAKINRSVKIICYVHWHVSLEFYAMWSLLPK